MGNIIGACSLCGGPVSVLPYSTHAIPMCEWCGASKKGPYGPVIEMELRKETPLVPERGQQPTFPFGYDVW